MPLNEILNRDPKEKKLWNQELIIARLPLGFSRPCSASKNTLRIVGSKKICIIWLSSAPLRSMAAAIRPRRLGGIALLHGTGARGFGLDGSRNKHSRHPRAGRTIQQNTKALF